MLPETLQRAELVHAHEDSVHEQRVEALAPRPFRDVGVKALARLHERGEHAHAPAFREHLDAPRDGGGGLRFHGAVAVRAVLHAELREEQAQKVIHLGDCGDGGFPSAARDALLDGDARRQAGDAIHVGLLKLLDELPRVRRHHIEEAPLPLGKKQIERERAFPRSAEAGDDHELIARDGEGDVLQVVLARSVDADGGVG